jgi:hypothetical protein
LKENNVTDRQAGEMCVVFISDLPKLEYSQAYFENKGEKNRVQIVTNQTSIINPGTITKIFAVLDEYIVDVEEENKRATKENKLTGPQKLGRVLDLFVQFFPSLGIIVSSLKVILELVPGWIKTIVDGYHAMEIFIHSFEVK